MNSKIEIGSMEPAELSMLDAWIEHQKGMMQDVSDRRSDDDTLLVRTVTIGEESIRFERPAFLDEGGTIEFTGGIAQKLAREAIVFRDRRNAPNSIYEERM